MKKYKLEYLLVAEKDIQGIAAYIATELNAPIAAVKLVREIRRKIKNLCNMPYIYNEYRNGPQNVNVYRAMPVKNYIVFYAVREEKKTVTIHRVCYDKIF